jgi:hypothetical protein
MRAKFLIFSFILGTYSYLFSQNELIDANKALISSIMSDNFSPPVASRIHLCANVAAYEVFSLSDPKLKSMSKLSHLSPIPKPTLVIDNTIAATSAFIYTGIKYIYTEDIMLKLLEDKKIIWAKTKDTQLINNSIRYGEVVSKHIIDWSKGDNYGYTRTLHRFELPDKLDVWKPTPPEYNNGLEPNWFRIRQVFPPIDSFHSFKPNTKYSEAKNSLFYISANEVYLASKKLTEEQKNIALFWDDNPMTTVSKGHVTYLVKKPTPVGHWLKITSQLLVENKSTIEQSSQLYTMVSIAAYDAFINCWNVKYKTNTIRPETYIQRLIDPKFKPMIETPPFPEYTSGHSTISFAIATVLTSFFPAQKAFTDSSQLELSLPTRKFTSIIGAASEASMSRFYGGIHFKHALNEGEKMGRKIGGVIVGKFKK